MLYDPYGTNEAAYPELSPADTVYGYPGGTAAPTSNPDGTSPDPFAPYTGYPAPDPAPAPTPTAPKYPPVEGGGGPGGADAATRNRYGNAANLDAAYLEAQIRAAFQSAGKTPTAQDLAYWIQKTSQPDLYSDNQWRVGWNPYWASRIQSGSGSSDPRLAGSEGLIGNPGQYGLYAGAPSAPAGQWPSGGTSGPTTYQPGANAFSDPATAQWEAMLKQLVAQLNAPIPASRLELQQTQALDPLERQRTVARQQAQLQLAKRGINPDSGGIYDETMSNVDRQFNELRTRTQAGFANQAATDTENRALQAVNLLKQVPQYQDTRLGLAQNSLQQINPASLLQLQQGYQNSAQQQSQFNSYQTQQLLSYLTNMLTGALK